MDQLETYHFQEKVEYRVLERSIWTVQGGIAPLLAPPLDELGVVVQADGTIVIRRTLTGDPGYLFAFATPAAHAGSATPQDVLKAKAEALHMVPVSKEDLNTARIEAGLPLWGVDFDSENLMPETGLENIAASYSKGCYQGQEVLARIRTYGAPRRGLVGLRFDGQNCQWPVNTVMLAHGTVSGEPSQKKEPEPILIKSNVDSPTFGCTIALAYVPREHRVPDTQLLLNLDGNEYSAKVVALPFYSAEARRKQAVELYDKALAEFTSGSEEKAIAQLREVLNLDPMFADAYEALGVALSRQDQLPEAIELMKQLERLQPESIMAHANLSVFYMQQGNKEAAEEEKALAMSIRMSQLAKEYATKQSEEADLRKRKEEAEHRMSMFKQVLEIDEEDFLANAGMGSAYVDLEQYAEAIPYLKRALATRPNHTVAYASLAQALEKLGNLDEAIEVYKKGVAVAAQRGDMTPMKDMQLQLERLGAR
jgi:folate-binding protein YgfZ